MRITFDVDKNCGLGYANLLRENLIESSDSVKAVAFSLSDGSSIVYPSEYIVDITYLVSQLTTMSVRVDETNELPYVQTVRFTGELLGEQLNGDGIQTSAKGPILECVDPYKDMAINIIYDKGHGYRTPADNRRRLKNKALGVDIDKYQAISAQFSNTTVIPDSSSNLNSDTVTLDIVSEDGREKEKLGEVLTKIVEVLQEIKQKL